MQTIGIKESQINPAVDLKRTFMIDTYKKGYLSLGEFAKALGIEHQEAMKLLSMMGVDIIDYDFEDDMKFMDKIQCKY